VARTVRNAKEACGLGLAVLLACARPTPAQRPPGNLTLHGTVSGAETGEPLGFSIVTLIPGFGRRFTDQRGAFVFHDLIPGLYLLSVRQIGYTPLDTQIVVRETTALTLPVMLRRLAVELPAITVTGRPVCTHPGPPDRSVTPALAAVFDQLQEHARRLELLADSHPFRFRLERRFRAVDRRGDSLAAEIDTIDLESIETRRPYRPGRVVAQGSGPFRDRRVVSLPSLHEFGDSAFLHNHCFRLVGRDTIAGETLVRIDFEPADLLRTSDVAGSAYLDSVSYELRFTETSLTKPQRAQIQGIRGLAARIQFTSIVAGIALQDFVRAVTTYRSGATASRVETQRLLAVHFKRPLQLAP
jgi:hypothetical protein